MKKKIVKATFLYTLALISCQNEKLPVIPDNGSYSISFQVEPSGYSNSPQAYSPEAQQPYTTVQWCVTGSDGYVTEGINGIYYPESSAMEIEGLREGSYTLHILGIRGDYRKDMAEISVPGHISDEWLSFPQDSQSPLTAEYFFSSTVFTVSRQHDGNGMSEQVTIPRSISQRRIISRVDICPEYNNDDIRTSIRKASVLFNPSSRYTSFTLGGEYSGSTTGETVAIDLGSQSSFLFMPSNQGQNTSGTITVITEDYLGERIRCEYDFTIPQTQANCISSVRTVFEHPNDRLGTRYVTDLAYSEGNHPKILQDGEPKEIYADRKQRSFNTSEPLQISLTGEGKLKARFYSPKDLKGVLVKALIPEICDEYFDLIYFETVPSFADFTGELHLTARNGIYRTESGKYIEIPQVSPERLTGIRFKIASDDPYWIKLSKITHGWEIYFSLYGGDPDEPDGKPVGNWMGIRPVHCREAVALFINFTYMIDMEEHEAILRENEDILYGNGGVNDKITADRVLEQMRQSRNLQIGLVYSGNGVLGLGGGNIFGAYQNAWLTHYDNYYACEVMFHELGHVMGYNHSSSFTYGPWAQQLMNKFYVDNLHLLPIDSWKYLDSRNNSTLYR